MSIIATRQGLIDRDFDPEVTPEPLEDTEENQLRWVRENEVDGAPVAAAVAGNYLGVPEACTLPRRFRLEQAFEDAAKARPEDIPEWITCYFIENPDAFDAYRKWLHEGCG